MKLTDTSVARLALPQGAADKIIFDDELPGFGLRIRAGGSRKFVVHYRIAGSQRRHTLGNASVLKVEEARRKARKLLVAVDDGKDPAAEKATQRAASGLTFGAVKVDYLAFRSSDMKAKTYEETDRYLNKHWSPIDRLSLNSISRATVATRLRELAKDHGPVSADRARASLSAFFAWCIGEGLCEANPVMGTNKASDAKSRDRILSDTELAAIWNATAGEGDYAAIVRLLMLTAQRRDEIGSLERSEMILTDGKGMGLIALPGARTKNGRDHDVPLSALALTMLEGVTERVGRRWMFGGGQGGYSGWSKSKAALDDSCGVTGWVLHDLRRTAATRMADLGVLPHVIEAILNHVSGHKAGVAGIYNRSTYAAEKRTALDLWANHLTRLIAKASGANVAPLRGGADDG